MATFVLIHGAWHGAWCWYKLVPRLEAHGHRVLALDLPGHGVDRSITAPATYRDYVGRVVDVIQKEPGPVVLVGHSMGGAVITGAAEAVPDKVAKLMYLCAYLAPSGQSMMAGAANRRNSAPGAIVPVGDGRSTMMKFETLRPALYADCPDEDVTLAKLCLVPQSLEPLTTPVNWTAERFGRIPRLYIAGDKDKLKGSAEEQRAEIAFLPGTEFVALNSSHSPFFSMPDQLANTLETHL